jgi:transcriptional regulator with XRE-family HTH domain
MPTSVFGEGYRQLVLLLISSRKAANLNQTELAERLGKGQKYISVIETGVRRIDLIEFVAFARALEIEPEQLLADLLARLPDRLDI